MSHFRRVVHSQASRSTLKHLKTCGKPVPIHQNVARISSGSSGLQPSSWSWSSSGPFISQEGSHRKSKYLISKTEHTCRYRSTSKSISRCTDLRMFSSNNILFSETETEKFKDTHLTLTDNTKSRSKSEATEDSGELSVKNFSDLVIDETSHHELLNFVTKYKMFVYSTIGNLRQVDQLSDPEVLDSVVRFSFRDHAKIQALTNAADFQNHLQVFQERISDIPVNEIPYIIYHLNSLCFSNESVLIMLNSLWTRCFHNFDSLSVGDIALLSKSVKFSGYPNSDIYVKVQDKILGMITSLEPHEIDLNHVCTVLQSFKNELTVSFLDEISSLILKQLKSISCPVSMETLSSIELFNEVSDCRYQHLLDRELFASLSRLEPFNKDITQLPLETCVGMSKLFCRCLWLLDHPEVQKLQQESRRLLQLKQYEGNFVDFLRLLNVCGRSAHLVGEQVSTFVQDHLGDANEFLFYQLLDACLRTGLCAGQTGWGQHLNSGLSSKVSSLATQLTSDQLDGLLWEDKGQVARAVTSLFKTSRSRNYETKRNIRSQLRSKLRSPDEFSRSDVSLQIGTIIDSFRDNQSILAQELSASLGLVPRLSLGDLLHYYRKLNVLLMKQNQILKSPDISHQAYRLKTRILESLEHRLRDSNRVPQDLVAYSNFLHTSYNNLRQGERRYSLWHRLAEELPRWISQSPEREDDCGRVLAMLPKFEHFYISDENLLDPLITSVIEGQSVYILSGLQLAEILARSGYQGPLLEKFSDWINYYVEDMITVPWISKSLMMGLAYHLSVLDVSSDLLLRHIFELDFLTCLQRELNTMRKGESQKVQNQLALLNRAVCIECPHLSIPWFAPSKNLHGPPSSETEKLYHKRVHDSLSRLCDGFLQTAVYTPYQHYIDFQLMFDECGHLVEHESINTSRDVEKLAVLLLTRRQHCVENHSLTGPTKATVRQLQMLGYHMVLIPHFTVTSMAMHTSEALDSYIKEEVNSTVGRPLL